MTRAGGISVHAIDVSRGIPAAGLEVEIVRLGASAREVVARGRIGATGMLDHPIISGENVIAGHYEATFRIGAYFRKEGIAIPDPAFLEDAPFRFAIAAVEQHFHLPLKFTPWGFSLFRGGA